MVNSKTEHSEDEAAPEDIVNLDIRKFKATKDRNDSNTPLCESRSNLVNY